jgi:hypothetical protein
MPLRRVVLAGVISFLVMFILGGLWNAVIMAGFYADNAPANARPPDETSLTPILLGYGLLALFMTFLFAQSFRERPTIAESIQFGALFGIIATLPLYLILYSVWDISLSYLLVDSFWHLVEESIGAVVLGSIIFPRTENSTSPLT